MKHHLLGKSSLHISEISLGAMSFPQDQRTTNEIISLAASEGINWIDTADLYEQGANEERIGNSLKDMRSQFHISTKVGNRFTPGKDGWNWDPNPKWINEAIEHSLSRLQTDYIDLYQLHGGTKEDDWDGIIETFERLKERGLIREYGISSIRPNVIYPYFKQSSAVSAMMQYSALDRRPESVFPYLAEKQIGLLVRGGQAKGLLTDQALEKLKKVSSYGTYEEDELQEVVQKMTASLPELGAVSLHHLLSHAEVTSVVVGSRTTDQLKDTLKNYQTPVSQEDIQKLVDLSRTETYKEHVD